MLNLTVFLSFLSPLWDKLLFLVISIIKIIIGIIIIFFLVIIYISHTLILNLTFDINDYYPNIEEDLCVDLPDEYILENHSLFYGGFELEIDIMLSYDDEATEEVIKEIEGTDSCDKGLWSAKDNKYVFNMNTHRFNFDYIVEAEFDKERGVLTYGYSDL